MSEPPEAPATDAEDASARAVGKPHKRWPSRREKRPPRHILLRLFGLSLWGAIKLALLCIIAGFFVMAMEFDPNKPSADIGAAIYNTARSMITAAGWTIRNFWKPALAGAGIVLPVWVLWRLATLPFRR